MRTCHSVPGKLICIDINCANSGYHSVIISASPSPDVTPITYTGSFTRGADVAVVSCNNSIEIPILWEFMLKKVPSTCIHIGDNIYMDNGLPTFSLALALTQEFEHPISKSNWNRIVQVFRQGYRNHWSSSHMKSILSSCSNIFLWDDHDVCDSWDHDICLPTDWKSYIDNTGNISWRDIANTMNSSKEKAIIAAIQVYCEYQLPLSLGEKARHIPGSFSYQIGNTDILFMDRRMSIIANTPLIPSHYSDTGVKPNIIVSCVPIFFLHPYITNSVVDWFMNKITGIRDLHDHWLLFPDHMKDVLSILKEGSILLSGDVHMCGKTKIEIEDTNGKYNVLQLTSSAISSPIPPRIFLWFVQLLNTFRVTIRGYTCDIQHQSWTRDNGYVTFNIEHPETTIDYILSSLVQKTM